MAVIFDDVLTATAYTFLGGLIGLVFLFIGALLVPKILNLLTPKIDEEKEIVRGNVAVAQYFGRIVEAMIIGLSIIIAAAIIAGIHG
jgi:hypothetical protein